MARHPIGLVVEFPIADFLLAINQSNSIGCALHLRLKEFMHAFVLRIIRLRVVPSDQQLLPLRVGQQRHIRQAPRQIGGQSFQHGPKMTQHADHVRIVETIAVVADLKGHFRSGVDVDPEREAGLMANIKFPLVPAAALCAQRCLPRRILEIEKAFEQPLSRRHLAPALDFHQRRVFMIAHRQILCAEFFQPFEHAHLSGNAHPERQRVDEQAEDRVRAFD